MGLKSADHLKKVCNMFRNNDYKASPEKYLQTLKHNINYENPEIYRGPVKTEIMNNVHGGGHLHLKVFKILNPKRATDDTDSAHEGVPVGGSVNKNVKVLLEEARRKLAAGLMSAEELGRRVQQMREACEQIRKGVRHPAAKVKPSNITTSGLYETAEVKRYQAEVRELEGVWRELKRKEEEVDMLGEEKRDVDYEGAKNGYPLRENGDKQENTQEEMGESSVVHGVSVNDEQSHSIMEERNARFREDILEEEEDDKKDLLKDIAVMRK